MTFLCLRPALRHEADAFEQAADGVLDRVILNLPRRHTQSKFAPVYFPGGRRRYWSTIESMSGGEVPIGFMLPLVFATQSPDPQTAFLVAPLDVPRERILTATRTILCEQDKQP